MKPGNKEYIRVMGRAGDLGDRVYIDIETVKVPAPEGWPSRTRWMPFMVGIAKASYGDVMVRVYWADEAGLIPLIQDAIQGAGEVVFSASSREFDRWVLAGRFTNARRALSPVPGPWPHLDEEAYNWRNVKGGQLAFRMAFTPSRDVPKAWADGERELVALHCAKDVATALWCDHNAGLSSETAEALTALLGRTISRGTGTIAKGD